MGLIESVITFPSQSQNSDFGVFGAFQNFDEFISYGFEAGYYYGARSYGLSLTFGEERFNDDGEELSERRRNLESFVGVNGIYRARMLGTKTKSNFRLHIGSSAGFNYRFYKGEEGTGDVYNHNTGRYEYPTKEITIHSLNLMLGFYLELGVKTKTNTSIILNFQPVSVYAGFSGYGSEFSRGSVILQF